MDDVIRTHLDAIRSDDREAQGKAFLALMEASAHPVDWAYEAWDVLLKTLTDRDNHQRAIGAQLLCNLAKSDPEGRILDDLGALLEVTRDARFVTARHCLLSLWKIGLAGDRQREATIAMHTGRFDDCVGEKNSSLIRYDIIQGLRKLYDHVKHESIRELALALIASDMDLKYRKKYASVWKK